MTTSEEQAEESMALANDIATLLAGREPEVQGAALADLLSRYIAGFAPAMRDYILRMHIKAVRGMVPASEKELFGEAGHPAGGRL